MQPLYNEISAGHFWNMYPSQFRSLPENDKAEMMAYYIVNRNVENYYSTESIRKMDTKKTGR